MRHSFQVGPDPFRADFLGPEKWPRLPLNDVLQIDRQFAELRICERLHDHEALHEKFAGEPPEALMGRYQARIIGHRDILTRLELE
jgi:hypothetical protein